jgi:peptidoglycan/LPS O-acetylase OafA/YrhL
MFFRSRKHDTAERVIEVAFDVSSCSFPAADEKDAPLTEDENRLGQQKNILNIDEINIDSETNNPNKNRISEFSLRIGAAPDSCDDYAALKDVKNEKKKKKKKEKKVWPRPPKIDTSAITGIRAITAIQIATGHWLLFYGSKNQVPIDFQGGLAVSTFFIITGFVLYVGYRHKVCDTESFCYWTFIKRRYSRALPLHWLCLVLYAPFVFMNFAQLRDDYNFWQNKNGEINLIMGLVLTPFLMHSWIFSLCYWNSVCWSLSCQLGFYFCFPWMCKQLASLEEKIEEQALMSSINYPRSLFTRVKEMFFSGGGSSSLVEDSQGEAASADDILTFELAGYKKYILRFYHLSSMLPLTLMGIMNSVYFRNIWKDKDFDGRADTLVTALDTDLDGVRAYFCARAWFPVRLPIFFLGMLLGAARMRLDSALRKPTHSLTDEDDGEKIINNDNRSEADIASSFKASLYRKKWATRTDILSFLLTIWIITSMVLSGIIPNSKNLRIFNEFVLTLPVSAWVFGLTATDESYSYKFLTLKIPQKIGQWSFAIYLLQFPFFSYWTAVEIKSMNLFPPCDRTAEHIKTWSDCFRNYEGGDKPLYPDVIVIAFVIMLVGIAALVHTYIEKPLTAFVQKKVG